MSTTLGTYPLGTVPLAGDVLREPPTVAVTAPSGTVGYAGPDLTVTWDYDQPQGEPQVRYRVRLIDGSDGTTVLWSSGWRAGSVTSFDVDFTEAGLDGEQADLDVEVSVRTVDDAGTGDLGRYQATDTEEGVVVEWGTPHCTVTDPTNGEIHTDADSIDVAWTFSDDRGGLVQGSYRVQLLEFETLLPLFDTGWVAGTDTSTTVDYTFLDGQQLYVSVQLTNENGIRSD